MPHILQSSAQNWKYQIRSSLRQRFCRKTLSFKVPYNLPKCGVNNQQLKCLSERKISSVTVLIQDLQKTGECFTVIKNCIQDILTGISH